MAITTVKIHPAIGFARVGNAPDEFFIGPERRWEPPDPPGGFKDEQCRIKRQAARFRIYAYHDDGTITELSAAEADIEWTVHLANKKASVNSRNPGNAADLTIDPGPRTLVGPLQRATLDDGRIHLPGSPSAGNVVPLGEIRTDEASRLIVLGGSGDAKSPSGATIGNFYNNGDWYDDISDGPVTARVRLHATGATLDAVPSWVIVAPPKFAPQLDSAVTLWDVVYDVAAQQGWVTPPASPSYTNDIYPVLRAADTSRWVANISSGPHSWSHPITSSSTRQGIFNKLRNPAGGGGNMPALSNSPSVTATQYAMLQAWKDDPDPTNHDWVNVPTPGSGLSPAELDRVALEACVGAAFYPGIEAGGITQNRITDPASFMGPSEPFRINHTVRGPGDMSAYMALPWQADFNACDDVWWPVPRPNWVLPEGETTKADWDRGVGSGLEMTTKWHQLGFVVQQGGAYVEVDRCDTSLTINLLTPQIDFGDVPQGPGTMSGWAARAIVFEVASTGGAVTLDYQTPPTFSRLTRLNTSVTVGPTSASGIAEAKLWLVYETGALGEDLDHTVVVRHADSGRTWTITIDARTVGRKTSATALVLDRSGSMSGDRGDGQPKHQALRDAAEAFVDLALPGDGVAVVRYDHDAQVLQGVTTLDAAGAPFGPRAATIDLIRSNALDPAGATSIGDGIYEGRQALNASTSAWDHKAMVVLTDGMENSARFISEVAAQVDARTFAVGLGTPQNTSAAALQSLSSNNGGYLLVTGAIAGDNRTVLQKYFLQILAGINKADVVLDPSGVLRQGDVHEIPFRLTEADGGIEVIVLTPYPKALDFRLRAPNGMLLEPWRAIAEPTMSYVQARGLSFYRVSLPVQLVPGRFDHEGLWHVVLRVGAPLLERPQEELEAPHRGTVVLAEGRPMASERLVGRAATAERLSPVVMARRPAVATNFETAAPTGLTHGRLRLPYSVLVHTYSRISMRASLRQSGYSTGATLSLDASVMECDAVPLQAAVWAEITHPDGSRSRVDLVRNASERYEASVATTLPGVYRLRVRARGTSRRGHVYEREQTLTASVWHGGDIDVARPPGEGDGGETAERERKLCGLLACVFGSRGVITPELARRLKEAGIDLDYLRRCLARYCARKPGPAELERREGGNPTDDVPGIVDRERDDPSDDTERCRGC